MNDNDIRADSFLLKLQNIRIYRVRQRGSGTVYFLKKDDALRYSRELQAAILQSRGGPMSDNSGSSPARHFTVQTRNQVQTLIDTTQAPHMKLFILMAVTTAARSGAILDLKWSQVNFDNGLIDFGRGWGNKRRAVVPINDDLHESLKSARELAQSDYVIEYHSKQVASVKTGFRRLCQKCNIVASPHVLRHTAATWLVMDGVPLAEVARLLGDSEKTVERVYGKHAPDYLRRAVSALNLKPKVETLRS